MGEDVYYLYVDAIVTDTLFPGMYLQFKGCNKTARSSIKTA